MLQVTYSLKDKFNTRVYDRKNNCSFPGVNISFFLPRIAYIFLILFLCVMMLYQYLRCFAPICTDIFSVFCNDISNFTYRILAYARRLFISRILICPYFIIMFCPFQ